MFAAWVASLDRITAEAFMLPPGGLQQRVTIAATAVRSARVRSYWWTRRMGDWMSEGAESFTFDRCRTCSSGV